MTNFVETCNTNVKWLIIRVSGRMFNSAKIRHTYNDFYFGFLLGHSLFYKLSDPRKKTIRQTSTFIWKSVLGNQIFNVYKMQKSDSRFRRHCARYKLDYHYYGTCLMVSFPWHLDKPAPKVKLIWIIMKQEMMGWPWHQLDLMQIICTSLQTDNHTSTSKLNLNKRTKTKPKPKPTLIFKNCSCVCAYHFVHNCRTQPSTEQFW